MNASQCDECGHYIPDDAPSLINTSHADTCSCYPHDEKQCDNCGRTLDTEGECRGGCSQDTAVAPHLPSVLADAIVEQVEWIEMSLPDGMSVMSWVAGGFDFQAFEFPDNDVIESVSHATGYLDGVSAALGISVARLLALASARRSGLTALLTRTVRS